MVRINNGAALLPKLSCLDNDNLKTLSFTPKKFREVGIINRKSFDQKDLVGAIRELIVNSLDSE